MKRDKEGQQEISTFPAALLEYQSFSFIGFFLFIIGPMIMAMIIFMRSAGINGITQIPRAALKVESATMQNHTVPKKIAYNCSCDHTNELDQRFLWQLSITSPAITAITIKR